MNGGRPDTGPREERHRLQVAADVAAWLCMGAFFATLAWIVFGTSLYIPSFGKFFGQTPLQLMISWVVAVPNVFATIWLARRNRHKIKNWFEVLSGATEATQGDGAAAAASRKRRRVLAALDIAAWTVLVVLVASLAWLESGWQLTFVNFLGAMSLQLLMFTISLLLTVFSIIWLVIRNVGWISRL